MAASITANRALPFLIWSNQGPASDNEQRSDIAESRINKGDPSFFTSLQQIFCELPKPSRSSRSESVTKRVTRAELRNLWQIIRLMAELLEVLDGRDRYQFLESVLGYLQWRVTSQRKKFHSWRNQPPEISALTHAINILNQLLHSGILAEDESAEHRAEVAELGRLLDAARKQARAYSLPGTRSTNVYRKAA